tara:strand:- start:82 stop:213 length:132 start_codon:yes stop_codon:yes gene_type:complete
MVVVVESVAVSMAAMTAMAATKGSMAATMGSNGARRRRDESCS